MNIKRAGTLWLGCMAIAGCSHDASAVGSYIGGDASAQMMLQIASVKDHDIRGKLIAVMTDSAGKVTAIDRALEGTIDAGAVNLNLETGSGLSLLTGRMTDKGLELTVFVGDKSQKLEFVRSDPNKFAGLVDGVRRSSAAIKLASAQEAARQNRLRRTAADQARIDAFTTDMASRADRVAESIIKIGALTESYRSTASRAARLASEQAGLSNGDYRLDQLSFARERNSDAAAVRHEGVTDALKELDSVVAQRETNATSMMALCQADPDLDCSRVVSIMPIYRLHIAALRTAVQREQSAYSVERVKF